MRDDGSFCRLYAILRPSGMPYPILVISGHFAVQSSCQLCLRKRRCRAGRGRQCPLWVKSRHFHCTSSCPLRPREQTFAVQFTFARGCVSSPLSDVSELRRQPVRQRRVGVIDRFAFLEFPAIQSDRKPARRSFGRSRESQCTRRRPALGL
jgi:hypothetical protein